MKAFKLELLVIDFDNIGEDAIIYGIENASYANDCINPSVKNIVCRDIGEWNDDHPLNRKSTSQEAYENLFR